MEFVFISCIFGKIDSMDILTPEVRHEILTALREVEILKIANEKLAKRCSLLLCLLSSAVFPNSQASLEAAASSER